MAFYFKNTKKDINMTREDRKDFDNKNNCRFRETNIEFDKVRDHCHLNGNYRGPAHNTCNINATQQQSYIIPFISHNYSSYDCHMFLRRLVDLRHG